MAKDTLEFVRLASPDEVAEYLESLALGLKRGELSLKSGHRALYLVPAAELKLDLRVKHRDRKGKMVLKIGWKRSTAPGTADLQIGVTPPPRRPSLPSPRSRPGAAA